MTKNKAEKKIVKIVITLEGPEAELYLMTMEALKIDGHADVIDMLHKTAFSAGMAKSVGAVMAVLNELKGVKQ